MTEDELIIKLTDAGLCLWKRPDGSYYEENKMIKGDQVIVYHEKPEWNPYVCYMQYQGMNKNCCECVVLSECRMCY